MVKKQTPVCSNHDCPAADGCGRYLAHNVARRDTVYFRPDYDPQKTPPCAYHSEAIYDRKGGL